MQHPIIIRGPQIYCENQVLTNSALVIKQNKIHAIQNNFSDSGAQILEFPANWHLLPGMIDMHIHGANGADTMDGSAESLQTMSQALVREGVTAFLPSTVIGSQAQIEQALTAAKTFCQQQEPLGAQMVGINLEGPFISQKKLGALNPLYVHKPDLEMFNHWQEISGGLIKITTIAPEEESSIELIRQLLKQNVIVSFGHSDANYETGAAAILAGCTHATHLFNAMRGIEHRAPNAVTALLLANTVFVELIADLIHLHPAILSLVLKIKGADKIILVTDAMRAKGLADGDYELGGQKVVVKNNSARLVNGTLAGSTLTMDKALRNMMTATGCSLSDAVKMVATNPAKQLKIAATKGSIAVNKDADLVLLDETLQVRLTMIQGKIVYRA